MKKKNVILTLSGLILGLNLSMATDGTIQSSEKIESLKESEKIVAETSLLKKAEDEEESPYSVTVTLNSDIFFGFYPFFSGSYALSDKVALNFYGILWSGGTGGGWGNWTEFGMGVKLTPSDALSITPQIGLLNGNLTSGGGTPVLAEGIVPNLTIGIGTDKFESEIYGGYYLGLDHGNANTNNYLHYWVNGGYKFNSFFSAGVHLEHLRFMGGLERPSDAASDLYLALGPYIQFADPKGSSFARFSAGGDLRSDSEVKKSGVNQPSFFKLTVGYSF